MPSVRGFTQEQKDHRSATVQCKKIRDILRSYMDGASVTLVAALVNEDHQSLYRKFAGRTKWDIATLTKVCNVLGVSLEDRARMLGWNQ